MDQKCSFVRILLHFSLESVDTVQVRVGKGQSLRTFPAQTGTLRNLRHPTFLQRVQQRLAHFWQLKIDLRIMPNICEIHRAFLIEHSDEQNNAKSLIYCTNVAPSKTVTCSVSLDLDAVGLGDAVNQVPLDLPACFLLVGVSVAVLHVFHLVRLRDR